MKKEICSASSQQSSTMDSVKKEVKREEGGKLYKLAARPVMLSGLQTLAWRNCQGGVPQGDPKHMNVVTEDMKVSWCEMREHG